MATYYAVYKLTNGAWLLWWTGNNAEAAQAEFRLCHQYGAGAKLRAFNSFAQWAGERKL